MGHMTKQIAQRSQKLLALLEEKAGAFVMDAYNYQAMDDEGTPLYAMNKMLSLCLNVHL